jgi:AsmA protein
MSMSRRLRVSLIAAGATVLALVLIALLTAYLMLRPEHFTRSLRQAARNAGLELNLTAPALPTLWPRPGIHLKGFRLFVQGQSDPLLIASHGQIIVPWRTLLGGHADIGKLQLDSPRLDLEQLRIALQQLSSGAGDAAQLPNIDTGISISNGTLVRGNEVLLQSVFIHTGALAPDRVFTLDLGAKRGDRPSLKLVMQFTPHRTDKQNGKSVIAFNELRLAVSTQSKSALKLSGHALWSGGDNLDLSLTGNMLLSDHDNYEVDLRTIPTSGNQPRRMRLKLDSSGNHVDMRLSPTRLAEWWQRVAGNHAPGPLPAPPLDGSIDASKIEVGKLGIKGLKVRSGDAIPAPASSAAPAASVAK